MARNVVNGFFAICFLLTGCKDPNYGQKALDFVNGKAISKSKIYTEKNLRYRLHSGIKSLYTGVLAKMDHISSQINSHEIPSIPQIEKLQDLESKKLKTILEKNDALKSHLLGLEKSLESVEKDLKRIKSICSNRSVIKSLRTEDVLFGHFFRMGAPEVDETYMVSNDGAQNTRSFVNKVGEWIAKNKIKEQNEKLSQAKKVLSENILRGEELFNIHEEICLEEQKDFLDVGEKALETYRKLRESYFEKLNSYISREYTYSSVFAPLLHMEISKSLGLDELFSRLEEADFYLKLTQKIYKMNKVVDGLTDDGFSAYFDQQFDLAISFYNQAKDFAVKNILELKAMAQLDLNKGGRDKVKKALDYNQEVVEDSAWKIELFKEKRSRL